MSQDKASYIQIHSGFIRNLKKMPYTNRVNWNNLGPKWDNFLILAPMMLINLQGDSKLINESE